MIEARQTEIFRDWLAKLRHARRGGDVPRFRPVAGLRTGSGVVSRRPFVRLPGEGEIGRSAKTHDPTRAGAAMAVSMAFVRSRARNGLASMVRPGSACGGSSA